MLVNGKDMSFSGITITKLLAQLNLSAEAVVVELNKVIIIREEYGKTLLYDADVLEIVNFVGGG